MFELMANFDTTDSRPQWYPWIGGVNTRFTGRCARCYHLLEYVKEKSEGDSLYLQFECSYCKESMTLKFPKHAFDQWEKGERFHDILDTLSLLICEREKFYLHAHKYYTDQVDLMIAFLLRARAKGSLKDPAQKGGKKRRRWFRKFK